MEMPSQDVCRGKEQVSKRMSKYKPQRSCHVMMEVPTCFKGEKKLNDPSVVVMHKNMQDMSHKLLRLPLSPVILR